MNPDPTNQPTQENGAANNNDQPFKRKKISPFFIDDISNISIAPNGACRLHFSTWNSDEQGEPIRVDTEVIMTMQSLKALSEALPQAIAAADKAKKA